MTNLHSLANKAMLFHTQILPDQNNRQDAILATLHDIVTVNNDPMLCEGKLLTMDDVEQMLAWMNNKAPQQSLSYLDNTILAQSRNALVWYVKGIKRQMLFRINGHRRRLNVVWPNLVFKVADKTLSVVAIRGATRPHESTQLFHAPLMNVYSDSRVCTGNADIPDEIIPDNRKLWEAIIFDTYFTHTNHGHSVSAKYKDNFQFWKTQHNTTLFKKDGLHPLHITLEKWIHV
jgi:PRTRC genetic system protein B